MRPIAQLAVAAATLAALFGCSPPSYDATADFGTVVLDLAEGPYAIDLHMEMALDDRETMSCRDLWPSFTLEWSGDEGDVRTRVIVGEDEWDEDTIAEDGTNLTSASGSFRRCAFDATVLIDSEEPLLGAISVQAKASGDGSSRGVVTGDVLADRL